MSEKRVVYNGFKFTRDDQTGYYLSTALINGKRKRLHRYIWEIHNGTIPKGYSIHHIDEDKINNDISNLELMKSGRHSRLHHIELITDEQKERRRKNLADSARPVASKWHRSKEGRIWHKKHYLKSIGEIPKQEYICQYCEKPFMSKPNGKNIFCSSNCKSANRRASGVDDVERVCQICRSKFTTNKYSKASTCSKECRGKLNWSNRRKLRA